VKVLSHEGRRVNQVNALHESLVSAHMEHPNVVRRPAYPALLHPHPVIRVFNPKTLKTGPLMCPLTIGGCAVLLHDCRRASYQS
jgi:hypothetical protein